MTTPNTSQTPFCDEHKKVYVSELGGQFVEVLTLHDAKHLEHLLHASEKRCEELKAQNEQEKVWKEEDPRMLREQCRVADVSYSALFEHKNKLQVQNGELKAQNESWKKLVKEIRLAIKCLIERLTK
jgi:hypothetical protein